MATDIVTDDQELVMCADQLIRMLDAFDLDKWVAQTVPATWEQGAALLRSENEGDQRLGYVFILTAIIATPGASRSLLIALRDGLRGHPERRAA